MNMPFLYFLNFLLIVVEVSVFLIFANGFFERKRSTTFLWLSFLLYAAIAFINVWLYESYTLIRVLVYLAYSSVWIHLNYRTSIIKCILISVLSISLCSVIDVVFATLPTLIYGEAGSLVYTDPAAYYILCFAAKLSEVFVAILIHTWSRHRIRAQFSSWADWLRVLFFPFCSLALSLYLATILFREPQLSNEILNCNLLLLVCNFFSIALLNYIHQKNKEQLQNSLLLQNLKLETEHIAALKQAYDDQRRHTHDFNNHLAVLRSLADRDASRAEFTEYLDQITAANTPSFALVNTHRLVADIVLSQKISAAKNKQITFRHSLDDLTAFPLSDEALVVVLTNLIDNAIEACEQIPDPEFRHILLKMHINASEACLYIENTTAAPVRIRDNQVASTKKDPMSHGYGLQNVYAMLDKENALYAIDYRTEDGVFCFSGILPVSLPK